MTPSSCAPMMPRATQRRLARLALIGAASFALVGCTEGQGFQMPGFLQGADAEAETSESPRATRLVERDVEAPDVFQVTEPGLWDGRPSLGGVWVAHPDVTEPERVIIRTTDGSNFVIGALFRKERATPGPRLQVSSDAAAALGLVAGQPVPLNVTALRREESPEGVAEDAPGQDAELSAPESVTATALDAPGAQDAPSSAPDTTAATAATDVAAAALETAPAPISPASSLDKPFLQIGIFSVESNATNTATRMRRLGLTPTIKPGTSSGKAFWRVVVGPASTTAERNEMRAKVGAEGFTDAYPVSN